MTFQPDPLRQNPRGRPPKEEAALLRKRLHKAALAEFLQNGYAGSSIESVARASGVSRTTIYALYHDKTTLFTEMLRGSVHGTSLARHVAFDNRSPVVVLGEAMRFLNDLYYREPNLRIFRLCIGEVDRFPELIESLRGVLSLSLNDVNIYLRRLRDEGKLMNVDCDAATKMFNLLTLGSMLPLMRPQELLSEKQRIDHLDTALTIFTHGILRNVPETPEMPTIRDVRI